MTVHMTSQRRDVQMILEEIPFLRPVWKTALYRLQCFIHTDSYETHIYAN